MKQLIVEIDDATAERLERIAPARARARSEFVRSALRAALDRALEEQTASAYRRQPDRAEEYFDPEEWEPVRPARARRRK